MNKNQSYTIKPSFPFIEWISIISFFITMLLCLKQYIKLREIEYLCLSLFMFTIFILFLFLYNHTNKTITISSDTLFIKNWIWGSKCYKTNEIKGFDIKEDYDKNGLVKNIRIWIDDKRHFFLLEEKYNNLNLIVQKLENADVKYLGFVEIKSRYKIVILLFFVIAGFLTSLGILIANLLKG